MNIEKNAAILDTETNDLKGVPLEIAFVTAQIECTEEKTSLILDKENTFEQRYSIGDEVIALGAMATHHIIPEDLEGMPHFSEFKLPDEIEYLIGHNIDYDIEAISKCNPNEPQRKFKAICTLALSRKIWPELDSHKLTTLIYFISQSKAKAREMIRNAHSAKADIYMTANLLNVIIHITGAKSMEELYQFSEKARIPTHINFGKHKGEALTSLPPSYVEWLLKKDDLDPYLREALLDRP